MECHIRPAVDGDLDRICEIALRAWARVHESFRRVLGDELYMALHSNWRSEKARQIRAHYRVHSDWVFVTEVDGRVVGFLTYAIRRERNLGEIGNNAVDPDFQGRGIATEMYRHALEIFRREELRYAQVHTGLDEGHAPARRAYEKAGFGMPRGEVVYHMVL